MVVHWGWLLPSADKHRHPVQDALNVADYIETLPETSATFKPSDIDIKNKNNIRKYLVMNNSWVVPDRLTGGGNTNRGMSAVNPEYPHIDQYADAPVKCECGAVIRTENEWYENGYGKCKLEGCCNSRWAAEARADMWQKREDIITESAELLRSPDYVATRLGISVSTLHYVAERLHIDRRSRLDESREALYDILPTLRENFTAGELSRILNRHESTIRANW